MIDVLLAVVLAQAAAPAAAAQPVKGPTGMTRTEIKAYNDKLPRDHPSYIRCVRSLETGSLVRRTTQCRTNAEWRRVEKIANDDARETFETTARKGFTNGG